FYFVLAIAAIGLLLNLNMFLMSFAKTIFTLIIIAIFIFLIYYFFFLTEEQRKYKRAVRKYRRKNRK
ncbi:SA1362 family protein, partial [Staphylococcus devriesei]